MNSAYPIQDTILAQARKLREEGQELMPIAVLPAQRHEASAGGDLP